MRDGPTQHDRAAQAARAARDPEREQVRELLAQERRGVAGSAASDARRRRIRAWERERLARKRARRNYDETADQAEGKRHAEEPTGGEAIE